MTGRGHRIVTFMAVAGVTGSPLAALCGVLGSTLPDSLEYKLWGRNRNRHHRKLTHWFAPWLALSLFCLWRGRWAAPRFTALFDGARADQALWGCVGLCFLGCVLHILEDALCGKVPILVPWRRGFGLRLFTMSPKAGRISRGERAFILFATLASLAAWVRRGLAL